MNEPLRVVCFGDSITGLRPREPYHHQFLKFSDLLGLMLEARLGMGSATVLNRGWAGQTSVEAHERLQGDLLDEKPDIAVVLLGGNDVGQLGAYHADTRASLLAIFSSLHESGIKTLALQYPLLVNPDSPETAWRHLIENNGLIAEIAAPLGIPVLDMEPVMQEAALHTPLASLVSLVDGVHSNFGGEMVYARAIFTRLDELGWLNLSDGRI